MLQRFLFVTFFAGISYCQAQSDSLTNLADTSKLPLKSTVKSNNNTGEESVESYYETLIYKDANYEIKIARNKQLHFNIQLTPSIQTIDSTTGDTLPKPQKSKISLNENFEYAEFKSITLELLAKIAVIDAKDIGSVKTEPLMDFQLSRIYSSIQRKIKLQNDPQVQQLRDRIELFEAGLDEKHRYAGQLRIKNDIVITYAFNKLYKDNKEYFDTSYLKRSDKNQWDPPTLKETKDIPTPGRFVVDSVYVSIFNNAIEKLAIYGYWFDSRSRRSGNTKKNHPSRVLNRSIGMRGLNLRDYHFDVNEGTQNRYYIKLNELLEYAPAGNNFSYIIKDQSFWIKKTGPRSQVLERRALYDYLSLITFLDFLGVSNEINNNFIQIEGRARFPLVLSTWAHPDWLTNLTLFPMFETYLNASFVNGNNVGGRKGNIFKDTTGDNRGLFYDHFDLLRNYNIKAGLSLGLLSLNYKAIHSKVYITYDMKLYRSAFEYTNLKPGEDSLVQSNLFALSHGPSLMFEYRPDFNIGADLRFSVDYTLSPFNSENNRLTYRPSPGPIYRDQPHEYTAITDKQKRIYGLELNAYSFLSPEKSKTDGIYFRFAVFTNQKFTQISPYILAGYATSLKGLIKKKNNQNGATTSVEN